MENAAAAQPTIPADLLAGLNTEQAEAVSCLHGPLAVIAGPGSGKTRVLTNRIAALVRTQVAWPSQILAVTFTNKAAGEMRERLGRLLGEEDVRSMWVCTFHSMCAKLLRLEHLAAGLPRSFSILDTSDVKGVLRGVLRDLQLPDDAQTVRSVASTISKVKNGATIRPDAQVARVYEAYQHRLGMLGAVDFDDLLLRALRLFESDTAVLDRYRRKFRYILVDEYQDTNPVQYRLMQLLAAENRNLCVVGDADQAIYGFRSASPEALVSFTTDWPEARVVVLNMNYRSTPQILDVCQAVIAPNPAAHRPQLRTDNGAGEPVRLVICPDDRDEAAFVAGELARLDPSTTAAVLTRTNAQTRPFEEALMRAKIRYSVVGTLRFYDRAEIKDALAYLRVVANPLDAVALARAVGSPRRGIGEKALSTVIERAAGTDLLEAVRSGIREASLGRSAKPWEEFITHANTVESKAHRSGPAAALQAVLDGGLWDFVKNHSGEGADDRLENLEELVSAAKAFEHDNEETDLGGHPWDTTVAFLEHIALVSSADLADEDAADQRLPVQLMTAHASKGKEFSHVYVAGVEEGFFPHARSGEEAPEDEERRLLFVACSRAENKLTLTVAQRRLLHGTPVEQGASRFLSDLPSTVVAINRDSTVVKSAARTNWNVSSRSYGAAPRRAPMPTRDVQPSMPRHNPAPGPRIAPEDAAVGRHVEHTAFGAGRIVSVDAVGDGVQVTVSFSKHGTKTLRLDMAPMRLAD